MSGRLRFHSFESSTTAQKTGENSNQIQRHIHLIELILELLQMVDERDSIPFVCRPFYLVGEQQNKYTHNNLHTNLRSVSTPTRKTVRSKMISIY